MELTRKILEFATLQSTSNAKEFFEGYSDKTMSLYVDMLHDAGFIKGKTDATPTFTWHIYRITRQGYELLESLAPSTGKSASPKS
jgi:predicted transcriptional regulator